MDRVAVMQRDGLPDEHRDFDGESPWPLPSRADQPDFVVGVCKKALPTGSVLIPGLPRVGARAEAADLDEKAAVSPPSRGRVKLVEIRLLRSRPFPGE
jgi:hypothetical protein